MPKTHKPRTTHARKTKTTHAKARNADRAGTKAPVVTIYSSSHSKFYLRYKINLDEKVKTTRAPKTAAPKTTKAPKTAAPKTTRAPKTASPKTAKPTKAH